MRNRSRIVSRVSALQEYEIFQRLEDSFRSAAEHCEALAIQQNRIKGQRYVKLREHLHFIEGASRQAAAWRSDARWLAIGQFAMECHKKCGDWLRFRTKGPMFKKCAENMRMMELASRELKDRATGRLGDILPEQPKYQSNSVQVSAGGILIPEGATLQ